MNPGLILACVVAEADLVVARQLLSQPPSTKAASYTVISATSAIGVVNVSMREPRNLKKRKIVGASKRKAPEDRISISKNTTSGHYLQFINDTVNITDEFPEMEGFLITIDNASIESIFNSLFFWGNTNLQQQHLSAFVLWLNCNIITNDPKKNSISQCAVCDKTFDQPKTLRGH
jgi:Fe-S cluster assembly iron-binding protein IscA